MMYAIELFGVRCLLAWEAAKSHLAENVRDERGEVSSTVVIVGIFVALAAAVGAVIFTAVSNHANNVVKTINGAQTQ